MFDFISSLFSRRSNSKNAVLHAGPETKTEAAKQELQKERESSRQQARQQYLQKIDAAANSESMLVELLLACDFADGRYHAAQGIGSRAALEKVKVAMRDLDKRVVKLMQIRLDEIKNKERDVDAANACVAQAVLLLEQDCLLPNQLTDLDTQRAKLGMLPSELAGAFEDRREALVQRLSEQTALQRTLLDIVHAIDAVLSDIDRGVDLGSMLDEWRAALSSALSHPRSASLPKNLVNECRQKIDAASANWKASQQSEKVELIQDQIALKHGSAENDAFEEQKLLAPKIAHKNKVALSADQIELALKAFETALVEGSIQSARKFERELRDLDSKSGSADANLREDQRDRLAYARKELSNLMSWAKWSGNVSRDELVATAEGLATLSLSPKELVGTVSALRAQWKQMESTSGAANQDCWLRFDNACKAAYAPAAQYFQEQDEQRKNNLESAQSQLVAMQTQATAILGASSSAETDWKSVHQTILQMQQAWRKIGHVERQEKPRIEAAFNEIIASLLGSLTQRQNEEITAREQLIREVEKLDSSQRNMPDQLRAIQERWKVQAASVPLQRKDEQALWDKFRAACDNVFAHRKQAAETADLQRQKNLELKLQLCARLEKESLEMQSKSALLVLQDQIAVQWRGVGQIPRNQETDIEQRYQAACAELKVRAQQLQSQSKKMKLDRLLAQISTCQKMEALLAPVNGANDADTLTKMATSLKEEWDLAAENVAKINAGLRSSLFLRFESAFNSIKNGQVEQASYQLILKANTHQFDDTILHLEILAGIDSPVELARVRLQKQVEVLQASLKNGNQENQIRELLEQLLCLPVVLDLVRQRRFDSVISATSDILTA